MKSGLSKSDQLRAMREAQFAAERRPVRKEVVPVARTEPAIVVPPRPVKDKVKKVERAGALYAVAGECECCDRRRARDLARLHRHRAKRKEGSAGV